MTARICRTTTRSAITRSKIPGVDWGLNPYVGCSHACVYCYAACMMHLSDARVPWGSFVDVKSNIVETLERQLVRLKSGTVMLSTATDAYQAIEEDECSTRGCLVALSNSHLSVSILTKSHLVLRDIEILKSFGGLFGEQRVKVGMSISTVDSDVSKLLEPGASDVSHRLSALQVLVEAGIPVWAFMAPVVPGLTDLEDSMRALLTELKLRGVDFVACDPFNFYPRAVDALDALIALHRPGAQGALDRARAKPREWKSSVMRRFETLRRELQ